MATNSQSTDAVTEPVQASTPGLPQSQIQSAQLSRKAQSRRHSMRSIKRRKFDDEIVESSLPSKGIRRSMDGTPTDEVNENLASPSSVSSFYDLGKNFKSNSHFYYWEISLIHDYLYFLHMAGDNESANKGVCCSLVNFQSLDLLSNYSFYRTLQTHLK